MGTKPKFAAGRVIASLLAVILSAPALAASQAALDASGPGAGMAAQAQVRFSIRIPPLLRMRTLSAPSAFEVPSQGRRVEVSDAATFEVQSNLKSPYELRFEITDPEVESVEIQGLDQAITVSRSGRSVRLVPATNAERTRRHVLHYRVVMAEGARPGPRALPIAYSLNAGI